MAYEEVKRLIKGCNNHTELNIFDRILAGGSAGSIAQVNSAGLYDKKNF